MKVRPLSPELEKKAREELNEDPERNEEDIRLLREWIEKQPHIKSRMDDQFLLGFIRASKHSLERAKKKIDLFYTIRTAIPELFKDRVPNDPRLLEMLRLGIHIFLPKPLCEGGPRICLVRPGVSNPSIHKMHDSFRPGTYAHDIEMMRDDNIVIAGVIYIMDFSNITINHFIQFDASFMKKAALLGGEGSPLRNKGTHYINTPTAFEKVFNLFKTFLSEKQRTRLFVHGSLDSLYQHIPQEALPKEYGGENGSISEIIEYWEKRYADNQDLLLEETQYGTDERLRPADSKFNPEALFGAEGTFRKLEVD